MPDFSSQEVHGLDLLLAPNNHVLIKTNTTLKTFKTIKLIAIIKSTTSFMPKPMALPQVSMD